MTIAEINTVTTGSTGRIMLDLAELARKEGHVVYTYSSKMFVLRKRVEYQNIDHHYYYGSKVSTFIHKVLGQATGLNGFFSVFATLKLVRDLEKKRIDVLHIHNIHEFCINIPILFRFIKKNHINVVWTLHDCWPFTGHCPYFTMAGCEKWKTGCGRCPQTWIYPRTAVDNTRFMWKKKKKWFTGVENMVLVTPSKWLAGLVSDSFLSVYPVKVINNGIDLDVFHPMHSGFRDTIGI